MRISLFAVLALAFSLLPGRISTLAQSGCAPSPAATAGASAPSLAPTGELGLVFADSSGGAAQAVAESENGYVYGGTAVYGFGARVPLPDLVRDLAISNGRAYVAAGSAGLQVLALDPQTTEPIGGIATAGLAAGVRVAGNRAYVAAAGPGGGLQILDIADPTRPRLLGSAPTYGSATALDLAPDLAYVAGGLGGGVEIFATTNPFSPTLRGALITPGNAQGIAVRGTRAYVAAGVCGLQVLDVAEPANPRMLGAVATGGEALSVAINPAGTRAVVAAGDAGYAVFELGAHLPRRLFQADFPQPIFLSDVSINDQEAVLVGGADVIALSLNPPYAPEFLPPQTYSGVLSLAGSRNDVVFGLANGMILSTPSTPPIDDPLGALPGSIPGPVRDIAVGTQRLYLATGEAGLSSFSTGFPQGITTTLALNGIAGAVELAPDESLAYVAAGEAGLHIIDLSEPLTPTLQRSIDTPGSALDTTLQANGMVLVADRDGFQIIDPTADMNPIGTYTAPAGSFVQAVVSSGERAYLADRLGVIVLDLRDRANPQPITTLEGFSAYNLHLSNERLYVSAGPAGVLVFSLADPDQPHLIGTYDTPGTALETLVSGEYVYIADNDGGLIVLQQIELRNRVYLPALFGS